MYLCINRLGGVIPYRCVFSVGDFTIYFNKNVVLDSLDTGCMNWSFMLIWVDSSLEL